MNGAKAAANEIMEHILKLHTLSNKQIENIINKHCKVKKTEKLILALNEYADEDNWMESSYFDGTNRKLYDWWQKPNHGWEIAQQALE